MSACRPHIRGLGFGWVWRAWLGLWVWLTCLCFAGIPGWNLPLGSALAVSSPSLSSESESDELRPGWLPGWLQGRTPLFGLSRARVFLRSRRHLSFLGPRSSHNSHGHHHHHHHESESESESEPPSSPSQHDDEQDARGSIGKEHVRSSSSSLSAEASSRVVTGGRLKAVIVSASRGYHNYRHEAAAVGMYDLLLRRGIPSGDIIVMASGDVATHPLNRLGGVMSPLTRRDVWYRVDPKKEDGADSGVFLGESVTSRNFVAALTGDPTKFDGAGNSARKAATLVTKPEDHVLVFFSGNAALGHLAFPLWPEDVLWKHELRDALKAVLATRVLVVLDTPFAASAIAEPIPHNSLFLVATAANQPSHATGCMAEMDEQTGERPREPLPCDQSLFSRRLFEVLAIPSDMESLDIVGLYESVANYTAPLQNASLVHASEWKLDEIRSSFPPTHFFGKITTKEKRERFEALEKGELVVAAAVPDNPVDQAEIWREALELDKRRGIVTTEEGVRLALAREFMTAQMRGGVVIGKTYGGDRFDYEYEHVKDENLHLRRNITALESRLFSDSSLLGFESLQGKLRNPDGIFDPKCYQEYFRTWAGTCGALGDVVPHEMLLEVPGSLSSACYFKLKATELARILLATCGSFSADEPDGYYSSNVGGNVVRLETLSPES